MIRFYNHFKLIIYILITATKIKVMIATYS